MSLTFGAVPHTDDDHTRVLLADFCEALSNRAGVQIVPHRSPSPRALASAFHRGRVQLAWTSPTLFVSSPAFARCAPLVAAVRQGRTSYAGVLFVSEDSAFRCLEDLRGARVAWGPPSSAAGYVMPRLALLDAGIDVDTFFGAQTVVETHGESARIVRTGEVDVGATFAVFRDADAAVLRAGFDTAEARVLLRSDPIPADLIVCSADVSTVVRSQLTRALVELREESRLAGLCKALFNAEGYRPFDSGPYEILRQAVERATT